MKTFAQYLTESEKTFDYRIKFCGDLPAGFAADFKEKLKKFEPVKVGEIKKTPIQSRLPDFPNFNNESMSIMDVTFRYPATPPQIQQLARLLGMSEDRVCMNDLKWSEGMDKELLGIEDQKDLLTSDYPTNSAEQNALKKDYAAAAKDKQVVKNSASEATWTVAGGKTPPAETTNDLPQGVKSPMTAMKRPPRPATGANPRG